MGYDDDPYRDEDGEPLMDYDEIQSDQDENPQFLDENLFDDEEEGWKSPETAVNEPKSKPRKRLVKKSAGAAAPELGIGHNDVDTMSSGGGKRKRLKNERREKQGREKSRSKLKMKKSSFGGDRRDRDGDPEVKEMWDTIAGGDSEDDQEGVRVVDDDNFIDDSGLDPADHYHNQPHSPGNAPQAEEGEEDDEIKELFKIGKKKKKNERNAAEIALLVENVMAELEVVAEEDAELNRQSKPAINKLKKLPLLTDVLSKKQLQQEFLDHGVLTLLKNWLEPLPDGSLPNINIRAAVLKILTDFPLDLEQYDRREQLKKSGLGKVIMFLSKSDEETTSNRRLAKDLVDKWSRPIFNKSTRFEDMKNFEEERVHFQKPYAKTPTNRAGGFQSRDDDLDLSEFSQEAKSGQSSSRQHASRPEALPLDFLVRPQSKIDPDEVRARAKQVVQDQRRIKMNKKLQQLKAPKKKQLQAARVSVEGRGMVKYL